MASRKKDEHAWRVCVSLTPYHRKMVDDILDLNDPDFPTTSRIFQVALREWFDAHVVQETTWKDGRPVVETRIRRGSGEGEARERDSRPSFSEAMDPFSGYKF